MKSVVILFLISAYAAVTSNVFTEYQFKQHEYTLARGKVKVTPNNFSGINADGYINTLHNGKPPIITSYYAWFTGSNYFMQNDSVNTYDLLSKFAVGISFRAMPTLAAKDYMLVELHRSGPATAVQLWIGWDGSLFFRAGTSQDILLANTSEYWDDDDVWRKCILNFNQASNGSWDVTFWTNKADVQTLVAVGTLSGLENIQIDNSCSFIVGSDKSLTSSSMFYGVFSDFIIAEYEITTPNDPTTGFALDFTIDLDPTSNPWQEPGVDSITEPCGDLCSDMCNSADCSLCDSGTSLGPCASCATYATVAACRELVHLLFNENLPNQEYGIPTPPLRIQPISGPADAVPMLERGVSRVTETAATLVYFTPDRGIWMDQDSYYLELHDFPNPFGPSTTYFSWQQNPDDGADQVRYLFQRICEFGGFAAPADPAQWGNNQPFYIRFDKATTEDIIVIQEMFYNPRTYSITAQIPDRIQSSWFNLVVVTSDNGTRSQKVYVNNYLLGTSDTTADTPIVDPGSFVYIGWASTSAQQWNGFIREIIVFNVALGATDISDLALNCGTEIKWSTDYVQLHDMTDAHSYNHFYDEDASDYSPWDANCTFGCVRDWEEDESWYWATPECDQCTNFSDCSRMALVKAHFKFYEGPKSSTIWYSDDGVTMLKSQGTDTNNNSYSRGVHFNGASYDLRFTAFPTIQDINIVPTADFEELTVSAWMRFDINGALSNETKYVLFSKNPLDMAGDDRHFNLEFGFVVDSGDLVMYIEFGGFEFISSTNKINPEIWYLIIFSMDSEIWFLIYYPESVQINMSGDRDLGDQDEVEFENKSDGPLVGGYSYAQVADWTVIGSSFDTATGQSSKHIRAWIRELVIENKFVALTIDVASNPYRFTCAMICTLDSFPIRSVDDGFRANYKCQDCDTDLAKSYIYGDAGDCDQQNMACEIIACDDPGWPECQHSVEPLASRQNCLCYYPIAQYCDGYTPDLCHGHLKLIHFEFDDQSLVDTVLNDKSGNGVQIDIDLTNVWPIANRGYHISLAGEMKLNRYGHHNRIQLTTQVCIYMWAYVETSTATGYIFSIKDLTPSVQHGIGIFYSSNQLSPIFQNNPLPLSNTDYLDLANSAPQTWHRYELQILAKSETVKFIVDQDTQLFTPQGTYTFTTDNPSFDLILGADSFAGMIYSFVALNYPESHANSNYDTILDGLQDCTSSQFYDDTTDSCINWDILWTRGCRHSSNIQPVCQQLDYYCYSSQLNPTDWPSFVNEAQAENPDYAVIFEFLFANDPDMSGSKVKMATGRQIEAELIGTGTPRHYHSRGLYFSNDQYLNILTSDGVNLPKKVVLYQNFDLFMWVFIEETDLTGKNIPLFSYQSVDKYLIFMVNNFKLSWYNNLSTLTSQPTQGSTIDVQANQWQHLGMTCDIDNGGYRLLYNGQEEIIFSPQELFDHSKISEQFFLLMNPDAQFSPSVFNGLVYHVIFGQLTGYTLPDSQTIPSSSEINSNRPVGNPFTFSSCDRFGNPNNNWSSWGTVCIEGCDDSGCWTYPNCNDTDCAICTDGNSGDCLLWNSNPVVYNGICCDTSCNGWTAEGPGNWLACLSTNSFYNGDTCETWDSTCDGWSTGAAICDGCADSNRVLIGGTCILWDSLCDGWTGAGPQNWIACSDSLMHIVSGSCEWISPFELLNGSWTCPDGMVQVGNQWEFVPCISGTYRVGVACLACQSSCASWTSQSSCQTWASSYTMEQSVCVNCPSQCATCSNSSTWTAWVFGYFPNASGVCTRCKDEAGYDGGIQVERIAFSGASRYCNEICGDGIDLGQYQWDDGNLNPGDGCNQLCSIEPGWDCSSTGCKTLAEPQFVATASHIDTTDTDIIMNVEFSEPVSFTSTTYIECSINPTRGFEYSHSYIENGLIVYLKPTEPIFITDKLIIDIYNVKSESELKDIETRLDLIDFDPDSNDSTTDDEDQDDDQLSEENEQTVDNMVVSQEGLRALLAALIGGAFVTKMMSQKGGATMGMMSLWHWIDALQVIQLLSYLNVAYPSNVEKFFELLGISNIDFTPNSFEFIFTSDEIMDQEAPGKFHEMEDSTYFFDNSGRMLQAWLTTLTVFPIIISFASCQVRRWMQYKSDYTYSAIYRTGIGSYIDLCLASFLQSLNLSMGSVDTGMATICAILTGVWLIMFPIYVLFFINRKIRSELKSEECMAKYGTMYEEYRLKGFLSKNFCALSLLRKLLQILILVYMQDAGIAQLWAFAGVNFSLLAILIYSRPYKVKIYNFVEIASEILYLLSNAIFGYITVNDLSVDVNFNLGWIIITSLGGVALVHLSLVIKDLIKDLINWCKKKCDTDLEGGTTKVVPINLETEVNDTRTDVQSNTFK